MPVLKAISNIKISKITRVYVLQEDGSLKLEDWHGGEYFESEVIKMGKKDGIPIIRDMTIYDILRKNANK